jgi:hypothetical protein
MKSYFLLPALVSLSGCAALNQALSGATTGQLFCAIDTAGGGQIVAGIIDADASAAGGPAAGEVAVLATNLAQATVQSYCQKAAQAVGGVSGVPVSPPTAPVASVAIHKGS